MVAVPAAGDVIDDREDGPGSAGDVIDDREDGLGRACQGM
jgi:hypothetical protein